MFNSIFKILQFIIKQVKLKRTRNLVETKFDTPFFVLQLMYFLISFDKVHIQNLDLASMGTVTYLIDMSTIEVVQFSLQNR